MSHKHHDHVLTVTTTLPPQQQYQLQLSQVQRLQQENANLQHQLRLQQQQLQQISSPSPSQESRPPLSPSPNRSTPDEEVRKSRVEVERLQDLVLVMGRKHLQAQAQLAFLQQQTQWPATPTSTPGSPFGPQTPGLMSPSGSIQGGPRSAALVPDLSQASLLASIAAVAGTTLNATREKPRRRFTLQTKNLKEDELTVEQRKCEFLMDQIANLQHGYDALRQEKSTLEIQLDLMHRQHHYHQQQRQKRRSSQRRTLGHDQSAALSLALCGLPQGGSRASGVHGNGEYSHLSGIPATPPLSATPSFFSTPEAQAQEVARIQYELAQAQFREEEEERRVQEQRRAAEKAEQEARRLRRQKSMHLKEALASLESKRNRSDNGLGQFSSSEDLKHLEQLQLFSPLQQGPEKSLQEQLSLRESGQQQQQQQQQQQAQQLPPKSPPPRLQLSPVGLTFQNAAAAAAAAGRKILSPFSPRVESEPRRISSSASSDTAPRSPQLSTAASSPSLTTTSRASSSPPTSVSSSFSSSSTQSTKQQAAPYTQRVENSETPLKTRLHRPSPSHTYDIEQCSCCIGVMIEL